jgi:diguanylate cyclase (GGDEF)-like protein
MNDRPGSERRLQQLADAGTADGRHYRNDCRHLMADIETRSIEEIYSTRIKAEQIRALYRGLPLSFLAILINSSILLLVNWDMVPSERLITWYLAVWLTTAIRGYHFYRFLHVAPEMGQMASWGRIALYGAWMSSLIWGATSIALWPQESLAHQAFLIVIIAGMTAGGISNLSPMLPAVMGFILVLLLPLVWRLSVADTELSGYLILMTVLFIVIMSISAVRSNRLMLYGLTTRIQQEQAEAQAQYRALYDDLTDLPNRRLLMDQLRQSISRAQRHGWYGALLFLDLDHFKRINDSLGHHVGDELLREMAQRLSGRCRDEDTVARIGGDEFVILLPELSDKPEKATEVVIGIADEIRRILTRSYTAGGHELHITASIGAALFPLMGDSPEDLLKHADTAMYQAKAHGRDNIQLFLPSMQATVRERLTVEKELRLAIEQEQLRLHYQPQVDSAGQVRGLEALVRWQHPERGLILPGDFIPIAEESGLILPLSDWVFGRVCQDIHRLIRTYGKTDCPVISFNLSPREFRRPDFVDWLKRSLTRHQVPAHCLCIEITESSAMEHVEQVISKMQEVRDLGVAFSIDDFGTGYSSLAYLKRLPVDSLKIDRSFVRDILVDANDAVIVETILSMARHMGIHTVAEGVETEEVRTFLEAKGCWLFQGWLFGKPCSLETLFPRVTVDSSKPLELEADTPSMPALG